MTRRRWIADRWTGSTATLEGEQAQHLSRVLRAQPGMEFDVVAAGQAWSARITSVTRDSVEFELLEELAAAAALPVALLLSVFKFDRMEWAIEKAVELGCSRILPVLAERTEKHLAQAAGKRVERWRRIALEAAQQSRRSDLPEIADPLRLPPILAEKRPWHRILLSETEEQQPLLRILQAGSKSPADLALAIGPEGGWTQAEVAAFRDAGWQSASLGPRILRVETAAIAALAAVLAIEDARDPSP
jgi:16S rRNA (uracil1498-N3)-methyltransferase